MGDRCHLFINCAGCGHQQEAYYAQSSGFLSFTCEKCKKINLIQQGFSTRIVSKEEEDEFYKLNGFE